MKVGLFFDCGQPLLEISVHSFLSFWEDFRNWLIENQIVLKNNSLSPELILGLRSDVFFHTQQYFFFLVARFFIWINKIRETTSKIAGVFQSLLKTKMKNFLDLKKQTDTVANQF